MELDSIYLTLSNDCNWTSDICPHHVYNFTNITEKTKMEGRQSRFLNLILGMDPVSMLKAKGEAAKPFDYGSNYEHLQYYGGTREINRYRAVVNVSKVVEMFSFLYVLKIIWEEKEGEVLQLHREQLFPGKAFQNFVEKIEKRHTKKMESIKNTTDLEIIAEDEEGDDDKISTGTIQMCTAPNDPYMKGYLVMNWYRFRKIGRLIMKNGWYIRHVWKAYMEYKKESKFSDRILSIVKLTQIKQQVTE